MDEDSPKEYHYLMPENLKPIMIETDNNNVLVPEEYQYLYGSTD